MTIRTIIFDDEQWQVVPQELTGSMIDTINGHIDADSDAVALWRDALIDAPEPPAQPRRPYGTDTMSEYGVIPECDGPEPPAPPPTGEHTDMLRDLLASYGNSGFSAERAALTAAIEALEPPAQPMVEFDIAIAAGDGTLHGAIDHWQERALTAEAKLAAQQPVTDRDRKVWRAALTLANNICAQESDRHNGDDETDAAMAASYCEQRIRDWIEPTDGQLAEMLTEAGIVKGEAR